MIRMWIDICSLFLSLRSHKVAPHSVIAQNVIYHKKHLKLVLPPLEKKYLLVRNSTKHSSYKDNLAAMLVFLLRREVRWVMGSVSRKRPQAHSPIKLCQEVKMLAT